MSDEQKPVDSAHTSTPVSSERVHVGYIPVPNLDRLMELRDALVALKGPLASDPGLCKNLQKLLFNAETDERVLGKISESALPLGRLGPEG